MLLLIGVSGKAESGKDTFAKYARDVVISCNNYWDTKVPFILRVGFADALKEEAIRHYNWNGVKDEKGRKLLQDLGQKRRAEDLDYWIKRLLRNVEAIAKDRFGTTDSKVNGVVFITDLRFKNEKSFLNNIELCKEIFGETKFVSVRIQREGFNNRLTDAQKNDISECDLDDEIFDYIVENNGELGFYIDGIETTMLSILGELR